MGRVYKFGVTRSDRWKRQVTQSLQSGLRFLRRREVLLSLLVVVGITAIYSRGGLSGKFMSARMPAGVAILDGDRLIVQNTEYQLFGIDAPEDDQTCMDKFGRRWKCGRAAVYALKRKIRRGGGDVNCTKRGKDHYGRTLGVCRQGKVNLNDWLVREGYAVAYRQYSSAFLPAESEARGKIKGLWSGEFVMPWDWRQGKRL